MLGNILDRLDLDFDLTDVRPRLRTVLALVVGLGILDATGGRITAVLAAEGGVAEAAEARAAIREAGAVPALAALAARRCHGKLDEPDSA